jgi:hypothetical protein
MAIRDLRSLSVALEPKARFAPESGHWMTVLECPLWVDSGHFRRFALLAYLPFRQKFR